MAYSAQAVANAFIERAKKGKIKDLTPMKLQKLIFYVQSWYLREHELQPLLDDHFARWKFGPVIPSLYHDLKSYGSKPVDSVISTALNDGKSYKLVTPRVQENDDEAWQYIDQVIETYGDLPATQLSWLTHEKGTAWALHGADGGFMDHTDMANHIHPPERLMEDEE